MRPTLSTPSNEDLQRGPQLEWLMPFCSLCRSCNQLAYAAWDFEAVALNAPNSRLQPQGQCFVQPNVLPCPRNSSSATDSLWRFQDCSPSQNTKCPRYVTHLIGTTTHQALVRTDKTNTTVNIGLTGAPLPFISLQQCWLLSAVSSHHAPGPRECRLGLGNILLNPADCQTTQRKPVK